ncbi:MAG TPA: chemotaxis protein CheB [Rhizomicrobium sp.]|nr:chemotaxis protein CheB [Rhizomicrobium sp.]
MDRIVTIGTSQGGVEALHKLVGGLPTDFPVPILVVLHIGAADSVLPSILNDIDGLKAAFARNGERVEAGHIYIAPPDRHMLLRDDHIELSRGPRENWARPAVDPLFRSAAAAYGSDAIGVVLSGRLNDGTAGLYEIKRRGGVAIVQTPSDAMSPEMPRSALENVSVDYCLPLSEIARLLVRLAHEPGGEKGGVYGGHPMEQGFALTEPIAQTCPECGGAMRRENVGSLISLRCHIGHVMTAEVLAATQLDLLGNCISKVQRLLNERVRLCRDLAKKQYASGNENEWSARLWDDAARQAAEREEAVQLLLKADWVHPEGGESKIAVEKAAE